LFRIIDFIFFYPDISPAVKDKESDSFIAAVIIIVGLADSKGFLIIDDAVFGEIRVGSTMDLYLP
jgi:hypothetical protein